MIKSWNNFTINTSEGSHELVNKKFPYQSIDSGKYYEKLIQNFQKPNINYFKSLSEINSKNSLIFNSVLKESTTNQSFGNTFKELKLKQQMIVLMMKY